MFTDDDICCCEAHRTCSADPHQIQWTIRGARSEETWTCIHCNTTWTGNPPRDAWIHVDV